MSQGKSPRTFGVPIVMDPEKETAYLEAKAAVDATAAKLLATAGDRIRRAREAAGDDPADRRLAGQAVVDADEAHLRALQDTADAAKTELDAVTRRYVFRALGRKAWKDLVAKHPATPEDHEQWTEQGYEGKAPWHEDGLARDLIHKAAVNPVLSPEDVTEIFDGADWNAAEVALLWTAALLVQSQGPQR